MNVRYYPTYVMELFIKIVKILSSKEMKEIWNIADYKAEVS